MGKYKRLALLAFVLAAFTLALSKAASWQLGFDFRLPEPVVLDAEPVAAPVKRYRGRRAEPPEPRVVMGKLEAHLVSSRQHTSTHAASLVELKDGRLRAFWFSGSREGAADVTINSAIYDPTANTWWREHEVAGRKSTQLGLHRYIAKVGNPVAVRAANGELWLFYVTVSLGGWAGSSITLMTSNDEGASWSAPRRLVTSPFINISTLVKGAPFFYADGTMGLPVYHEFISKFSEILRLDHSGKVIDKQRLAAGGQGTLQPVVLVRSAKEALVLNRYSGKDADKRVVVMASEDGGRHWQPPHKNALHNPDAALTALALLFSFFRVNPSPFCVMDEADAPLDEANVERFVRLLREFSGTTQFIVISLKDQLFEKADGLIGIFKEQGGSEDFSKCVTIDMRGYAE